MHPILSAMKNIFILFFCFIVTYGFSQKLTRLQEQELNELFRNKKEIQFTFLIKNKKELSTLTRIISIDNVKNGKVWAFANKEGFKKFLLLKYSHQILTRTDKLSDIKTENIIPLKQMNGISVYPTYLSYEAMMAQFALDYPSICKLVNIGTLPSGHKLLLLKITDNINVSEDEPQFLYTSTMHGDETAGYVGMLNYIDFLLSNYGSDARVTSLINNMEIWINPLANPDGTYAGGENTVTGATRFNANAVDLNRNYPDPQAGLHPDGNSWQPETQAFMAFADSMNFVMAANFHGGAEVVNYPWDTWSALHADNNWWIRESQKYADTVFANSPSGYFTSVTSNGIINGYDWYPISGGRQDYMNYYKHCREVTIEISDIKILPTSDITNNWNYNYKSYLNYMEECLHGIRGIVVDACTNQPIKTKVFITGHDIDSSHVYSSLPVGNYHRPIYQGTYNVTFSAPGYITQTINNVAVTNGSATILNVSLSPSAPIADINISNIDNCNGTVTFNDLSGSANTWYWRFGDGNVSTSQNPTHIYNASGTYSVSLVVTNCAGIDSVFKNNYLTINIPDPPSVLGDSSLTCGPTSLTLTATASGTVNWYSTSTGGAQISTGNTFTTPALSVTTTYYAENEITGSSQFAGPSNNLIGTGGFYTAGAYHYLRFTANSPFKLISVWVNANTTANRTVELRNNAGIVLQSTTLNIPAGQSRITLNFDIPVGTDLQLGLAGGNNLYRNSSGGAYPYSISSIVSITGNSANNNSYYYYFYDWEIALSCVSNRFPATAIINPADSLSTIISSVNTEICEGETAFFNSVETNGGTSPTYQWLVNGVNAGTNSSAFSSPFLNNSDAITCTVSSSNICAANSPAISNSIILTVYPLPATPVIAQVGAILNSNGTIGNQWYSTTNGVIVGANGSSYSPISDDGYFVIVTDSNGCSSDTSNIIYFSLTSIAMNGKNTFIHLYPNPCNDELFIDYIFENNAEKQIIEIFNSVGVKIFSKISNENKFKINCEHLANGIYFLKVTNENESYKEKFIVQKKN